MFRLAYVSLIVEENNGGASPIQMINDDWLFTIGFEILHYVQNDNYLNRSLGKLGMTTHQMPRPQVTGLNKT